VPLIVGLARALELCAGELEAEARRQRALRDRLWARLDAELAGVVRNGHAELRLPGNLNVSFEGVDGDRLLLSLKGIACSSGSACSSATPEPSHVLAALGRAPALARASLRLGLGRGTTAEEIEAAADAVVAAVRGLREGAQAPARLRAGC
jgi:cysteine desulfurase